MFDILVMAVAAGTCFIGIAIVIDRLFCWGLRLCAPFLPDDICGPDGWLVDTENRCGVFDAGSRA